METLLTFCREFGVPMGLVMFFTLVSWFREKRQNKKIDALDAFTRKALLSLVKTTSATVKDNTTVMQAVQNQLKEDAPHRTQLIDLLKETRTALGH